MKTRCLLTALFGLWFMVAPWTVGFADHSVALWVSEGCGAVQVICSLWAFYKRAGDSLPNLLILLTGFIFAIMPFTFLPVSKGLYVTVFGMLTIVFSFRNLGSK